MDFSGKVQVGRRRDLPHYRRRQWNGTFAGNGLCSQKSKASFMGH